MGTNGVVPPAQLALEVPRPGQCPVKEGKKAETWRWEEGRAVDPEGREGEKGADGDGEEGGPRDGSETASCRGRERTEGETERGEGAEDR